MHIISQRFTRRMRDLITVYSMVFILTRMNRSDTCSS
jgi:hypothetical protein